MEIKESSFSSDFFLNWAMLHHPSVLVSESVEKSELAKHSVPVRRIHCVFSIKLWKTKENLSIWCVMTNTAAISGGWFYSERERGELFVWRARIPSVCPNCQLVGPCCCGILWMASTLVNWIASLPPSLVIPFLFGSVSYFKTVTIYKYILCTAKYFFNPEWTSMLSLMRRTCDGQAG